MLTNSANEIIESSQKNLRHEADLIELQFSKYLEGLRYDINHLSKSPYLYKYLAEASQENKTLLEKEYLSLLNSNPNLSQIRFIENSEVGNELVRVERRNNKEYVVPNDSLQSKGSRDYFTETIRLSEDSVYVSRIDLNKEYGKISEPLTPTLRVAQPVFIEGKVIGIIVLNTNLTSFYKALSRITGPSNSLYLVNNEGYYVYHSGGLRGFGFEFNEPAEFLSVFDARPDELKRNVTQIIERGDNMYYLKAFDYPKKGYEVYAVLSAQKTALLSSYYSWRNKSLLIFSVAGLISILVALLYMRRQATQLMEITNTINEFPKNPGAVNLELRRKDEIGALAESFREMSTIINDNVAMLKVEKEKAEQAVFEKNKFLENMSHEIRNPLQSIIGMSEILEKNNPGEHQKNIIKSIRTNSFNLHSLVTDILDYNNMIRNEITQNPEWFSPKELLDDLLSIHAFFANSKKLSIVEDIKPLISGIEIYLDRIRLTQVLNNLITNAIKYTYPETSIKISVHGELTGDDIQISFKVRDEGPGMSYDLIRKIKSRYFRGASLQSFTDSFGLGLHIVMEILKAMGSKLEIDSEPGRGSSFVFTLKCPYKKSVNDKLDNQKEGLPDTYLAEKRMLIIDDDLQVQMLYRHLFEGKVKQLVTTDLESTTFSFGESQYDIIISDYKLGSETIMQKLPALTEEDAKERIVYIVSALSKAPKDVNQIYGFRGYIGKPFHNSALYERVVADVLGDKFGRPNVQSIKEDYDNEQQKYNEAFKLLINEWRPIREKLVEAILKKDIDTIDAIGHKIITTVRRLRLQNFETFLANLVHRINSDEEKAAAREAADRMQYYIVFINKLIR